MLTKEHSELSFRNEPFENYRWGRGSIKIVEETVCTKDRQDKIVCNNILMLDQKFIIEDMMPTFL